PTHIASVLQMIDTSEPYSHSSCGLGHALPSVGAAAGQPETRPPLDPLDPLVPPLDPLVPPLDPLVPPLDPLVPDPPSPPPMSAVFPEHASATTIANPETPRPILVPFIVPSAFPVLPRIRARLSAMQARCSVFIATSLDGFIARSDGRIDWLAIVHRAGEDY